MALMVVSFLISAGAPCGLLVYFYKREKMSLIPLVTGIAVFIVFTQMLEKALHVYLLQLNPRSAQLFRNPWLFAAYGGLAAGLFEEGGRFVGFNYLLKRSRKWIDGISYGIGHGGAESFLIGGLANLQYLLFAVLINNGVLEAVLGGKLPPAPLAQLKQTLVASSPLLFLASGIERLFALAIQIALSLVVLYAVRYGRYIYLLCAVLIHALLDFPAALYQAHRFNLWGVEVFAALLAVLSVMFIIRSKALFPAEGLKPPQTEAS